jgi:CHAD domain-containing protein
VKRRPNADAWTLRPELPHAAELRRVGEAQAAALAGVALSSLPVGKRVHGTRRHVKRLRAWLRLLRIPVGERAYRRWNVGLRDLGRRISRARDADVLAAAWDAVGRDGRERKVLRRLAASEAARVKSGRVLEEVAADASALVALACAAVPVAYGSADLREAVAASHRWARRQYRRVRRSAGAEELHELRKRVKVLFAQAELCASRARGRARRDIARLDRLGKLLGREHDLAVLDAYLARRGTDGRKRIAERRSRLRGQALALAALALAEKPEAFARRMAPPDPAPSA